EQLFAALDAGDRARHDNRAALRQVRYRGAREVKVAIEIGLERAVEVLVAQLLNVVLVLLEGGGVDENVPTAEPSPRFFDRALAKARVRNITRDEQAGSPFLLDRALCVARVIVFVEVGYRDVGAFAGKEHGNRTSDAGIAAADECDHALQLVRA